MKRFLPFVFALAACSDSALGPNRAESLVIEIEEERVIDASVVVGDSVQLKASIDGGRRPGSANNPTWMSESPAVASVSQGGVVKGIGEGSTRVIATAGLLSDTIFITVLAGALPASGCESTSDSVLTMSLGQVYTTTAAVAPRLCFRGGSEYVLIPFHAARSGSTMQVEMQIQSTLAPPPSTTISRSVAGAAPALSGETDSEAAHRRLRELEARELTPLIQTSGPRAQPRFSIVRTALPVVGEYVNVNVNSEQTCSDARSRRARVAVVSARAVVLVDEQNPTGGFGVPELSEFARLFDEIIYPTVITNFGEPTDIDGNGRVIVLFTRAVNELTAPKADSYTAGFFFARDLFPTSDGEGFKGCSGSNYGEILYMLAPDPNGEVNGNSRTRNSVGERTPGVLAHELQHLVNASRRLRILGQKDWSEEFWLSEGLSHIAEELTFYTAAKLQPRSDINSSTLRLAFGPPLAFEQFQANNFNRYSTYLKSPESASPIDGTSLMTRGAIWAFLRYAADRIPGSEPTIWRRLVDNDDVGYANLSEVIDASPLSWVNDWTIAAYVHRVTEVPLRYRQPSWHFRSIYPLLPTSGSVFLLRVRDLRFVSNQEERLTLSAGGAAYFRLGARTTDRFTITTTSGGAPPPKNLRLTLVRVR